MWKHKLGYIKQLLSLNMFSVVSIQINEIIYFLNALHMSKLKSTLTMTPKSPHF